jgi:hypothetical protein
MPWTQTDTSFKKLSNKRITTSVGKGLPEEKGASTLELYLPDIKTGLIPGTGFAGYGVSGYLFYHGPTAALGQTLAVDTSVPGNLTWFATTGWGNTTAANDGTAGSEAQRLGDWVSDKYDAFGTVPGAGYEIKVYDRNNNLITKSDSSNWLFDYQTGILVFNNDATSISTLISTSGPFKIVGWRYVGPKGVIPASYGGLGYTSYNLGDLFVGAGSTVIPLPVGANNYILSADSSTSSGLRWIANSGGSGGTGSSVYIAETPPPYSSSAGDLWYNSENGALNIYYVDVDTAQWVEINSAFGGVDPPANFGIGITQINNIGSSAQFLYAGFSGSTFNISSTGNSHTFNIPISGVGVTGLVSGFAQTFGGIKTFQNGLISGNGVTIYGALSLPSQPLSSIYGGTGITLYNLGDLLVGAGTSIISLPSGSNGYILQANSAFASGLGWTYVSNVNVSETAPSPAITGDLWWNSIDGSLSVYFVDVDSTAQWVEVGNAPSSSSGSSTISGIYYLNGLYDSTQYLSVGAGNSFYVNSISNTHTIQIPLAGSGFTGLMSGIAQTFSGNKTFQNDVVVSGMLNFTFATIGTAGITTSPSIAFIGQTNNPISLNVLPDNSLSFDSASGQLFKISNDLLADYIYSVNDVSGLPIIRAKSDSTLTMAEYGSNVGVGLSNPTYKLQVSGDVYASTSKVAKGFIETVYGFGTTSGTITPNWNNGSTQTMTLNNNLTLNAPVSMPTGSSMKLVITQDVSGSRLLSPNGAYKFLGGVNTLTTAGNAIDIINVFYDGTNYLSEIKKNYS